MLDEVVAVALAGRERIALSRLAQLPPALARLVVIRLAEDAAGARARRASARASASCSRWPADGGSAQLDVGGGVRAVVEYGVLRFERRGGAAGAEPSAAR